MTRTTIFFNETLGASMLEVILALAIVAVASPFVYNKIIQTNHDIENMVRARDIAALRSPVLNFVRINQDKWPETAQIKLSDAELDEISDTATAAFVDKYSVRGAAVADVYISFDAENPVRANRIARYIGADAAVVGDDGVAYSDTWAVAAPDFKTGNIIYRISRATADDDKTKYLHRASSGDDGLNIMMRDLRMGGYNVLNVGRVVASSAKVGDVSTYFVASDDVMANNAYFSNGANMDGSNVSVGEMQVSGDITGFRNIYADNLNGGAFTTRGRVIADRATVTNSVNVGGNFSLKSSTTRTISGFTTIEAHSVATPYISVEEMTFIEKVGLTVSGELMVSTTPPLKIGSWVFPSTSAPRFADFSLSRAEIPDTPTTDEFDILFHAGWRAYNPDNLEGTQL